MTPRHHDRLDDRGGPDAFRKGVADEVCKTPTPFVRAAAVFLVPPRTPREAFPGADAFD
jgi:hypothetical protein